MSIFNNATGALMGTFPASAGTGRITGLTNGTAYTVVARATAEGLVWSGDSNTATETPLGGGGPAHVKVFDRTMLRIDG